MPKFIEVLVRRTYHIFSCLSFLLATIGIFGDLFINEPSTRIAWGDLGFYAISFWAFVTLTLWLIKKLTYKFWPTWYDKESQSPFINPVSASSYLPRFLFSYLTQLLCNPYLVHVSIVKQARAKTTKSSALFLSLILTHSIFWIPWVNFRTCFSAVNC